MIRICKICGKEFDTNGTPAKCCSKKCMAENNKLVAAERARERWQQEKIRREKKDNMKKIVDLTVEARKNGMSYGQYVAQMYMGRR